MPLELTTVSEERVVLHDGAQVHVLDGLAPDTTVEHRGITARTLPRPGGELLCRFATVNDVHFGEIECGRIDDHQLGPIQRVADGEPPYPETMNRAAVSEIAAIEPAAVIVKGDLTSVGADDEYDAFLACYRQPFGDRLYHVRGNHDAYEGQTFAAGDQRIDLPGVTVALVDTVVPRRSSGRLTAGQVAWLDALAAEADRPVLVMGHHQNWVPSRTRSGDYFGINPTDSEALIELVARRPSILGYFAGHTHRHRVRHVAATGAVPYVEVGCTKDFPGTWAEYRVFEGGILQVVHRMSSGAALAWSEGCRNLYLDFGVDYETYALGTLGERCFPIPLRT